MNGRTASVALLSLSSVFALFKVPTNRPNIVFPLFRSRGSEVRSSRGRFRVAGAAAGAGVAVGSVEVSIGTSSTVFVDGFDSTVVSWGFLRKKHVCEEVICSESEVWAHSSVDILELVYRTQ